MSRPPYEHTASGVSTTPPAVMNHVLATAVALTEGAALTAAMCAVSSWNPLAFLYAAADRAWVPAGEAQEDWRTCASNDGADFRAAVLLAEAATARFVAGDGYLSGRQLAALGARLDEILDEWEALLSATASSARRFVGVFERHVWRPFVDAGMPADQVDAVTAALRRLAPLAQAVNAVALRVALQDAAASFVAEQARRVDPEGVLPPALHQGVTPRRSRPSD